MTLPALGTRVRARYALRLTQYRDSTHTVLAAVQPAPLPIEITGEVVEHGLTGTTLAIRTDPGRGLGVVWVAEDDLIEGRL